MFATLFKFLLRLLSLLPLPVAHYIGTLLGYGLYFIPNNTKNIAAKNISFCFPSLNANEQKQLLKKTLIESGKTLAEMGVMWLANSERTLHYINTIEGEEHLQDALKENKGVLLAMPHIGSWELVNLYAARHYPVTSLYKPPRYKGFDQLIKQARERTGANLVPTDTRGVRAVSKALKKGEVVVILPDQQANPRLKNGIFASFYNQPAYSMTLMPKLVDKFESNVIYAYTKRQAKGAGFTLVFKPGRKMPDPSDIQQSVEMMNRDIESVINDCPSQYQWTYKRFRHRPDNLKRFY